MLQTLGNLFVRLGPQHKTTASLEFLGPIRVVRLKIICVGHHALLSNDVLEDAQILHSSQKLHCKNWWFVIDIHYLHQLLVKQI